MTGTNSRPLVGVLALQGDFALHRRVLEGLGVATREIRGEADLEGARGLVLPGGESTTILKLMERMGMDGAIARFHARGGAMFGTCAGAILLARGVTRPEQRSLGLLDVDIERNAYGRQVDSFETDLLWPESPCPEDRIFRGVFIRAPRFTRLGRRVETLLCHEDEPVLVREDRVLASTFHPELTPDPRVHRYFVERVLSPEDQPLDTPEVVP